MQLNKNLLFTLIWIVHLFVYYITYSYITKIILCVYGTDAIFFEMGTLALFIAGPIGGLIGFIDNIPGFILIPVILMYVLLNLLKIKKLRNSKLLINNWHLYYVISIVFSSFISYALSKKTYTLTNYNGDSTEINIIFIILPSLIISIILNWLIFRKKYKKFSGEIA